jgi:hypothetical protein
MKSHDDRKIMVLCLRTDQLLEALQRHGYLDAALAEGGFAPGQLAGPDVRLLHAELGIDLVTLRIAVESDGFEERFRYRGHVRSLPVDLRKPL